MREGTFSISTLFGSFVSCHFTLQFLLFCVRVVFQKISYSHTRWKVTLTFKRTIDWNAFKRESVKFRMLFVKSPCDCEWHWYYMPKCTPPVELIMVWFKFWNAKENATAMCGAIRNLMNLIDCKEQKFFQRHGGWANNFEENSSRIFSAFFIFSLRIWMLTHSVISLC